MGPRPSPLPGAPPHPRTTPPLPSTASPQGGELPVMGEPVSERGCTELQRGSREAPRAGTGPQRQGRGQPWAPPRDQRGRAAGMHTVAPGCPEGLGPATVWACEYHGGQPSPGAPGSALQAGQRALPCPSDEQLCPGLAGAGGGQERAGLLPGQLGDQGPQSLRDRGKQRPTRGNETREGKNHEGATCGRGRREKRSAPPALHSPAPPTNYGPPAAQSVL